jgi:hypothetical protein
MATTALFRLSKPLLLPLSIVGAGGFYGAWDLSQKAASTLLSFDPSKQSDVHSFLGTAGATALSCTAVALRSRFDPPPLPPAAQAAPPGSSSAAGGAVESVKHALRTMARQATAFPYRYYVVSVFGGAVVLGVSQRAFQKCLHVAGPAAAAAEAPSSSDASA